MYTANPAQPTRHLLSIALFLLPALLLFLLAACSSHTPDDHDKQPRPTMQEDSEKSIQSITLPLHSFILTSVNGKAFSTQDKTPYIGFDKEGRIFGSVCNNFTGQAQLKGNILTAPHLASTRMFCPGKELNALEIDVFSLLEKGATIRIEGKTLFLEREGLPLGFTQSAKAL